MMCVTLLVYTTFYIPHDTGVHHVLYGGLENVVYTGIMWFRERGVHQYHVVEKNVVYTSIMWYRERGVHQYHVV
jgi:hypothetical protein